MSKQKLPQQIELQIYDTEPLSRSYLEDDTKDDPAKPFLERKSPFTRFSGWRGGVLFSIVACAFVLLLNIILIIVSGTAWKLEDNIATAFTGNCKTAGNWTTALHLLINLFGSLLLGASNYCMQRLVAPTRKEVDDAHDKKQWLDIGVPSIRNLPRIDKKRALLWLLLGLSSVPLHLLYNSVVFETIAANEVDLVIVTEEFFQEGAKWKRPDGKGDGWVDQSNDTYIKELQKTVLHGEIYDSSAFEYLEGAACKDRYREQFITTAGTGFVLFNYEGRSSYGINESDSVFYQESGYGDLGTNLYEPYYDYCYSQIIEQKCQVQFSLTILAIVIACNAVKLILMCIVLWRLDHETIVTIGDAIKCFLQAPDPTTQDCCLMSRRTVSRLWKHPELRTSQRWLPRNREAWSKACSTRRWIFCLLLCIAALGSSGALLALAADQGKNGFGRVSASHIIDINVSSYNSIIPYALVANSPQAIISFLYLTYNGLFTGMLANREWSNYAIKRAPLRVTYPEPGQRSTYFLQLPYFWSVPLLAASVILHWFVSQSIFLARISIYRDGVQVPVEKVMDLSRYQNLKVTGAVFSGVGFSDTALTGSIVWGALLVGAAILVGFLFAYPKGLPVGGTNSAVISAACHVKYKSGRKVDEGIPNRPLQWGVTIEGSRERVGHCCFSDCEVEAPKNGHLYAGVKKNKFD